MPLYTYEAADKSGAKVRETMEAANVSAVKDHLHEHGLVPLNIKEGGSRRATLFARVSQRDLMDFTQELGNLLESGMPIDKAVYVLSEYLGNAALRDILKEVYKDLQRGQSLSQALTRHSIFPPVYINMVRAGEAGGILESVIVRLANFLEASVAFKQEIVSAIFYPVTLTIIIIAAVTFLMLYVIPQFMGMFESTGQQAPMSMKALVAVSQFVGAYWWAVLLGAAALVLAIYRYIGTSEGQRRFDALRLRLPLIGALHVRAFTARFARTLGTLLQSGVPILEAIKVSREVIGNKVVSEKLDALIEGVREGKGISGPLKQVGVFPPIVVQVVTVGEEAGNLDKAFIKVADRFEIESRRTINRLMSVLPTLLIVLMAGIVGFIVYTLLMTVFSINDIPF